MPPLITSKNVKDKNAFKHLNSVISHDIKSHPLTIDINLFKQLNINQILTKSKCSWRWKRAF